MDIRAVIAGVWRWIGHFSLAVWLWAAGLGALVAVGIGAALFYWDILPIGLRITLLIGIAACVGAMWLDAMPTLKQTVRARSSRAETREEKIALELAKENYSVGGQRIAGDRFFLDEAISFREVKSEQSFAYDLMIRVRNNFQPTRTALTQEESEWIFDKEPRYAAHTILDDWYELGLLTAARETKPGAQPSAQGTYESYYAMPKSYTIYSLSPTGIAVLAYLKQLVILPSVRRAMSQQRPTS